MSDRTFNESPWVTEPQVAEALELKGVNVNTLQPRHQIAAELTRLVKPTIEGGHFHLEYQPIVDIVTRQVVGLEPLLRTRVPAFANCVELLRAAAIVGESGRLGRKLRELAAVEAADYPLFLNIFPAEFDHGWLVRPDDPIFKHKRPVYMEITESVPLAYFEQCRNVLTELRKKGLMLAIDDLGSGYSNLKYIVDLEPEVVKLDRGLVAGVRLGSRQYRLLRSIVRLCHDMGAKVVAEGVELVEELVAVREASVDYVQGFLLARPANPPPTPSFPDDF